MNLYPQKLSLALTEQKLPCGYTAIPLVVNGQSPSRQVSDIAQRTFTLLEKDSADDKLASNYTFSGLKLHEMLIYTVLWDFKQDQPVLVTGAHQMTPNTCRLFSRYYLFKDYRTGTDNNRYDKVDDFQLDLWHYQYLKDTCNFFFWSREKGNKFFSRIKQIRPDIFLDWQVLPNDIQLIWENNWQGIFYTCSDDPQSYLKELIFNK